MLPVAGMAEVEVFDDTLKGLGPRLNSPPKIFIMQLLDNVSEMEEYSLASN